MSTKGELEGSTNGTIALGLAGGVPLVIGVEAMIWFFRLNPFWYFGILFPTWIIFGLLLSMSRNPLMQILLKLLSYGFPLAVLFGIARTIPLFFR